jgi:hypothetical protein
MSQSEISIFNQNRPALKTPWAILVCRFKDMPDTPFTIQDYQTMFTAVGVGSFNTVDYFRDVSHQMLDLSGSKVFGPIVLDQNRSDYKGDGSPAGQQGRLDFLAAARQKAIDGGANLNGFFSIVVCVNVPTEYWGGAAGVLCDSTSVRPAVMGQEMGHAYGLSHSRANGSTLDYQDPWDVMSGEDTFETPHPIPTFQNMGPLLNAANVAGVPGTSWLDENRVWTESGVDFEAVIQLRPLVRYDLPGFLAARIGDLLVEFRVNAGWDAGIPNPAVLVHRFEDGISYLMTGKDGRQGLTAGGSFSLGDPRILGLPSTLVEVVAIEEDTATIRLAHRVVTVPPPRRVAGPVVDLGGVSVDGGGLVIIGDKVIRVPPRSPVLKILQMIAELDASAAVAKVELRNAVRRDAYAEIAQHAQLQLTQLPSTFRPAPRVLLSGEFRKFVALW